MPVITSQIHLTWIENSAYTGYKKMIHGKVRYLGRDREQAEAKARTFLDRSQPVKRTRQTKPVVATKTLTTHEAIDQFVRTIKQSGRAVTWQQTIEQRLGRVKLILANAPMTDLDFDACERLVNHYVRLPVTMQGTNMAPQTAVNFLRTIRQWLEWCDASGRWEGFRRWEKLFSLRGKLKKQSRYGRIEMLDLSTFATLLKNAPNPQVRAALWCAINCGWTQTDLSTFAKDMIVGEHIARARHKTGVEGRWRLWERTREAIQAAMAPEGNLVFRTAEGLPLIHFTDRHKCDALTQKWYRLTQRVLGRRIPFKQIRKLGAQLVRDVSDLDMSQTYLAHTGGSVAETHYVNPVWERLDAAIVLVEGKIVAAVEAAQVVK